MVRLGGEKLYLLPVQGSGTQWYKDVLQNPSIRIDARGVGAEFRAAPMTDAKAVKSVVEKFREKYKCAWERRRASFGHSLPRDEAYYGDPGTHYAYSRREYKPLPWIPELLSLKARVEEATPVAAYANLSLPTTGYNAVLCNLYRDGNDSVGLHADAEPEMGPVIASESGCGAPVPAQAQRRYYRIFGAVAPWQPADYGGQHAEALQA